MSNEKQEIEKMVEKLKNLPLRDLIDETNKLTAFYNAGCPMVTDETWDTLYFIIKEKEKETGIIYPDSPTQIVYGTSIVVNKLEKVEHNHPMLSLDKTKDADEIQNFVKGQDWYAMFKMDGLTCSLTYENGELVRAETRGDGIIGEDILHNVEILPSVPRTIPTKDIGYHIYDIANRVVIDGEIICRNDVFEEKYSKEYSNPRNFAAGNIRQLDNSKVGDLTFVAWDLIEGIDEDFNFWRLEKLDDWGFVTVPRIGDAETVSDAIEFLDSERDRLVFPIDGYVFKFESKKYGESLGRTDHHFKNAIAYKFYDEEYETKLRYIDYDVSRNGVLTPVAVFEPIEIEGSVVERASLHNISVMENILGETPYKGQKLLVFKANQIIPQVSKAVKMDYSEIIEKGGVTVGLGGDYGVLCPICGGLTRIITSDAGIKNLVCDNPECSGKLAQRIDHYCGKKGLDIKGISRKTIEKLIEWGWLDGLADIYKLSGHKTEWVSKSGFGEASVRKILLSIDASKAKTSLVRFIAGIGIPLVGTTVAKEIVKYYSTWADFREAIGGDWSEFEGFGPEISKAINNFDYSEADEIAEIVTFENAEIQSQATLDAAPALEGKVFVITGKVHIFKNRDELKADIEKRGGRVAGSVTSKTDYLINNDNTSTSAKNIKAKELGVSIITEEEYTQMTPGT